jgi:hypothetical protein
VGECVSGVFHRNTIPPCDTIVIPEAPQTNRRRPGSRLRLSGTVTNASPNIQSRVCGASLHATARSG